MKVLLMLRWSCLEVRFHCKVYFDSAQYDGSKGLLELSSRATTRDLPIEE